MGEEVVELPEIIKVEDVGDNEPSVPQRSEEKPDRKTDSETKEKTIRQTRSQTRSQSSKESIAETTDTIDYTDIEEEEDDDDDESSESKTTKKRTILKGRKRKRGEGTYLPRVCNSTSYEASWSERDKQRLLIALQRYGILEMDKLLKSVPGKSEEDIKKFICIKWKAARKDLRERLRKVRKSKGDKSQYLGPVDKWLEVLNTVFPNIDHYKTNPLAHAVLLIWKYEKHPDPSECGGVDFKALYEHMYYMLCGYPAKHLNQPTAAYLADSLKNFASRIKTGDWSQEMDFLSRPLKVNTKSQPNVTEDDVIEALSFTKEQCVEKLSKMSGFNPFSIPEHLLRKKVSSSSTNTSASSSASADKEVIQVVINADESLPGSSEK